MRDMHHGSLGIIWEYHEGYFLQETIYATLHTFEDSRSVYYEEPSGTAKEVVDALERIGEATLSGLTELGVPEELEEIYKRGSSVRSLLDDMGSDRRRR